MRKAIWIAAVAALPVVALAADNLDWAYPVTPRPEPKDNVVLKGVPGSTKKYTQAQIDDGFNPPDWFPDEHPPMPQIVAHGVRADGARLRALSSADRRRPSQILEPRRPSGRTISCGRWPSSRTAAGRASGRRP